MSTTAPVQVGDEFVGDEDRTWARIVAIQPPKVTGAWRCNTWRHNGDQVHGVNIFPSTLLERYTRLARSEYHRFKDGDAVLFPNGDVKTRVGSIQLVGGVVHYGWDDDSLTEARWTDVVGKPYEPTLTVSETIDELTQEELREIVRDVLTCVQNGRLTHTLVTGEQYTPPTWYTLSRAKQLMGIN